MKDWEKKFREKFTYDDYDGPVVISGDVHQADRIMSFMKQQRIEAVKDYIDFRKRKEMCDTAPFVYCNNAEGCDSCEYQYDDQELKEMEGELNR